MIEEVHENTRLTYNKIADKYHELFKNEMEFQCTDYLNWNPLPNSIDGSISYYSIICTPKKDIDILFQIFKKALKPNGKFLIVLKKGDFEGYQDEVLGIKVHAYFAEYKEDEIELISKRNGYNIEELITRKPYQDEIDTERIYCLCSRP